MGKVGLAVVTYKDNFGSALQTYATQEVIQRLGFETGIFDITGVHRVINIKKISFYLRRIFEPDEFDYLLENLKSRFRKKANSPNDKYAENMQIRHRMYDNFNKMWLEFMPRASGWKKLSKQSEGCAAVIVGSDQLWRPSNIAGGYFTLEFVPKKIKKIAYSTSFGVSELPNFQRKKAAKFLKQIKYISVRENTGKKIVKELTGRDVSVVCDPTMLLDSEDWMKIQKENPIIRGKYILCYFMGDNPQHRSFVKGLKEETGYKIVGLLHGATYIASDNEFADESPYDVGPAEFINLIRNAEYMCTDSFHGTVFAILNQTNFFAFRRYEDRSKFSTNDRLHTLLGWTGLSDRMIYGNENIKDMLVNMIDYDAVLEIVNEKREHSLNFLKKALNEK